MNNNSKHIDEVFQQRFQDFEANPPEQVWEQIKSKLPSNNTGTLFSNPVSLASITAVLIIALFMGVNLLNNPEENYSFKSNNNQQKNVTAAGTETPLESRNTNNPGTLIPTNETEDNKPDNKTTKQKDKKSGPSTSFGKTFQEATTLSRDKTQTIFLKSKGSQSIPKSQNLNFSKGSYPDHTLHPSSFLENDYRRKPEWQIGIHFTPEIMFYPDDNIQNQSAYRFNASISYQFSDFFIESGIGFNFAKDAGDYKYNKYMGTYDDVYLVTFDTSGGAPVPTYHTNPVDVFDTTESYKPTTNRYTYLEVPLLIGFKKQVNRFTYFVKAGPSFSFMIHKNIPEEGSKDKYQRPYRKNTNAQIVLGAGLGYRIHRNFSLSAEPTFRYYINSAYERRFIQSKNTYSIGFRAGLIYHF